MSLDFSKELKNKIFQHVMKDLDPSWLLTHTKVGTASILGGLLSLVVCGQFGIGFTPLANSLNHAIHANMGSIPCAIICGMLYAAFPVTLLRFLLCPPLQFRAIMKRRWQAILVWFGGFGGLVATFGHHGTDILTFAGWIAAAIAGANLIAWLMNVIAPAWDTHLRLQLLDQK